MTQEDHGKRCYQHLGDPFLEIDRRDCPWHVGCSFLSVCHTNRTQFSSHKAQNLLMYIPTNHFINYKEGDKNRNLSTRRQNLAFVRVQSDLLSTIHVAAFRKATRILEKQRHTLLAHDIINSQMVGLQTPECRSRVRHSLLRQPHDGPDDSVDKLACQVFFFPHQQFCLCQDFHCHSKMVSGVISST